MYFFGPSIKIEAAFDGPTSIEPSNECNLISDYVLNPYVVKYSGFLPI